MEIIDEASNWCPFYNKWCSDPYCNGSFCLAEDYNNYLKEKEKQDDV